MIKNLNVMVSSPIPMNVINKLEEATFYVLPLA
jgi:hypothetical protein